MAASKEGDLGRERWQGGRQQGRSSGRKKDGECGGQRGRRFGQGEEGDESCRFGSVVVSSLAAGEREYENGRLGSAGAAGVLLV